MPWQVSHHHHKTIGINFVSWNKKRISVKPFWQCDITNAKPTFSILLPYLEKKNNRQNILQKCQQYCRNDGIVIIIEWCDK